MYAVLQHATCFTATWKHPVSPSPWRPSRLPPTILQQAIAAGILKKPMQKPLLYHTVFPVVKANGNSTRLISDPPEVNRATKRLWPCHVTRLPIMVRTVCAWTYAVQYDATSFYFQFSLGDGVARWFGVRQSGVCLVMVLTCSVTHDGVNVREYIISHLADSQLDQALQ